MTTIMSRDIITGACALVADPVIGQYLTSVWQVYRAVRAGMPALRVMGRMRFSRGEVLGWIESCRVGGVQPSGKLRKALLAADVEGGAA